jgi:radical SAM protein with 4Fe4S-binding SPASM domain
MNYKINKYLIWFPKKIIFLKLFNLFKFYLSKNTKIKKLNYLPITMDIEPTTGCNFRCTMCQVSSPNFISKNLNYETFKKIIDDNKQLLKIKLQGMGEPLVNNNFYNMVEYASKYSIVSEITTNGSLLNNANIKKLLGSNLSRITVSIDGASSEVFEKIRVKSNFKSVIFNCKNLIELFKKKIIRPEISAWCVIQNDNVTEFEKIYDLCREIGFDKLTYQFHLSGWGKSEWNKINSGKKIEINSLKQQIEKIKQKGKKDNMEVNIFEENLLSFNKQCVWPWESSYISKTGDVVPCCIIGDEKVISFGNIKSNSFKDIWNSENYKNFREDIKNNKIPNYCKNCYQEFKN